MLLNSVVCIYSESIQNNIQRGSFTYLTKIGAIPQRKCLALLSPGIKPTLLHNRHSVTGPLLTDHPSIIYSMLAKKTHMGLVRHMSEKIRLHSLIGV